MGPYKTKDAIHKISENILFVYSFNQYFFLKMEHQSRHCQWPTYIPLELTC